MKKSIITAVAILIGLSTQAGQIGFYHTSTTEDPTGASVTNGLDQLSMDVIAGLDQASFIIYNSGPVETSAKKICLEYTGSATINYSVIGNYLGNGDPAGWTLSNDHLPGEAPFDAEWCITAPPPPSENGITPYTSPLEIVISYDPGSFDLYAALFNEEFRVGLHQISSGEGQEYSDTFINNPVLVPEPTTALLLGFSGLLVNIHRGYRKKFCL